VKPIDEIDGGGNVSAQALKAVDELHTTGKRSQSEDRESIANWKDLWVAIKAVPGCSTSLWGTWNLARISDCSPELSLGDFFI